MFISLALRTFSAFTVAADAVADVTSPKPDEQKKKYKIIEKKSSKKNC